MYKRLTDKTIMHNFEIMDKYSDCWILINITKETETGNDFYGYAVAIADSDPELDTVYYELRGKEGYKLCVTPGTLLNFKDGIYNQTELENYIKENNLKLGALYE